MVYSYYPGCTLKNKARDLDEYGRKAAAALGMTLNEIPEWQCCGAVYPLAGDEIAQRLSAVRALSSAGGEGNTLLTLCSACHNVIKRVNNDMANNRNIRVNVNNYLKLDEGDYDGGTSVMHYIEALRDDLGFKNLAAAVTNPLKGMKVGAYYGCLLLRPSAEMAFDNAENPTVIENLLEAMGAQPVYYAMRNECCGGYQAISDAALTEKMCERVLKSAKDAGAEHIVTACPLCRYNLKKYGGGSGVKVWYFTELLAMALGIYEGDEAI